MAGWITHCMIADRVLAARPDLIRREFAVGSVAPDCNLENEDWTSFTPPRCVTHFMRGERKTASDAEGFYAAYLADRSSLPPEQDSFLLGYYAHLITDGAYQAFIRDTDRVKCVWDRIKSDPALSARACGMEETWDSVKMLLSRSDRARETRAIEARYLASHPDSTYFTEILAAGDFPDRINILPPGAIARKLRIMSDVPAPDPACRLISVSMAEIADFVDRTCELVLTKIP